MLRSSIFTPPRQARCRRLSSLVVEILGSPRRSAPAQVGRLFRSIPDTQRQATTIGNGLHLANRRLIPRLYPAPSGLVCFASLPRALPWAGISRPFRAGINFVATFVGNFVAFVERNWWPLTEAQRRGETEPRMHANSHVNGISG